MPEEINSDSGAAAPPIIVPEKPASEQSPHSIPPVIHEYQTGAPGNAFHTPLPTQAFIKPPRSGSSFLRWVVLVAVSCFLGVVLFLVADHFMNPRRAITYRRGQPQLSAFKLTEGPLAGELQAVIESQLSAFRDNDYPAAYGYAAAGFKAEMPLPAFERLIKANYPAIAQSRSAQFGVTLDDGSEALVNVTVVALSGRARQYQYILRREGGVWRIFGVTEIRAGGMSV